MIGVAVHKLKTFLIYTILIAVAVAAGWLMALEYTGRGVISGLFNGKETSGKELEDPGEDLYQSKSWSVENGEIEDEPDIEGEMNNDNVVCLVPFEDNEGRC